MDSLEKIDLFRKLIEAQIAQMIRLSQLFLLGNGAAIGLIMTLLKDVGGKQRAGVAIGLSTLLVGVFLSGLAQWGYSDEADFKRLTIIEMSISGEVDKDKMQLLYRKGTLLPLILMALSGVALFGGAALILFTFWRQ